MKIEKREVFCLKRYKIRSKVSVLIILAAICMSSLFWQTKMEASAASSSGWVTANSLTVRSKASASSAKYGYLHKGDKITITGSSGNFYKFTYNKKTAYVSKSYISSKKVSSKENTGSDVIEYATQFVGNPYKWGGTSLTKGADCSGFVQSVYKHFGYSLPRTSSSQRSAGKSVSWSNRQPGDIICYNGHVALYMGNNKIVHANSTRTGIIISSVNIGKKVVAVRRIIY
jgi:cell wall-associated NlpC family hydrolase